MGFCKSSAPERTTDRHRGRTGTPRRPAATRLGGTGPCAPRAGRTNPRPHREHPLASLFQGTGALATFLTAIACVLLLRRGSGRSSVRLFLIWMAYNGFFQSLPQAIIGAVNPGNDV